MMLLRSTCAYCLIAALFLAGPIPALRSHVDSQQFASVKSGTKTGIIWTALTTMLTKGVLASHEVVIRGLLASRIFNEALATFLRESDALELLVLKASKGWLTKALCGLMMTGDMSCLGCTVRGLSFRVRRVDCEYSCQRRLHRLRRKRRYYQEAAWGTIASTSVDVQKLVADERMRTLFMQLLAESPGLLQGLDEERMSEVFRSLRMEGVPVLLSAETVPYWIKVDEIRRRATQTSAANAVTSDQDSSIAVVSSMIDRAPEDMVSFVSHTMVGFINAMLSEDVFYSPELPNLLNAAFVPWRIKASLASGPLSLAVPGAYAENLKFTNHTRKTSVCPGPEVLSSYFAGEESD
eukprot:TRINITY_DN7846_c0_g2_i1.p1 TRINITY_DN7846_c0_g2~~TRINITY_DN7846_c0_g2_i1.p1  ORF type:complete len:361 (+),score=36.60 TRINITY_DN7846_c0_g2_i1:30-1085(+)